MTAEVKHAGVQPRIWIVKPDDVASPFGTATASCDHLLRDLRAFYEIFFVRKVGEGVGIPRVPI